MRPWANGPDHYDLNEGFHVNFGVRNSIRSAHNDGFTLHWPGDTADMQTRARELQAHAFVMCPSSGVCRTQ